MKINHIILSIGAAVVTLTTNAQLTPPAKTLPPHAKGELLVKFDGGPRGAFAEQARDRMRHEVKRHFDFIGWQYIRLPNGMSVEEGLMRYRNLPGVLAVEPNGIGQLLEPAPVTQAFRPAGEPATVVPNDPMFPQQWGLAKIGVTNAWAVTTGSTNVIVAILSTGVNYNHEDLRANMWRNPGEIPGNRIDDDGNGYVDDVYGIDTADDNLGNDADPMDQGIFYAALGWVYHGTINAGIIGAVGNNGLGIAGINRSAQIMAFRFPTTNSVRTSDTIEALDYIHLMKGRGVNIRVINLAYWSDFSFQAMWEAHQRIAALGILQVTIARPTPVDHDLTPVYPASLRLPGMISVATSDQNDNLAGWSGYGRNSIEVAAPGIGIPSTSGPFENSYTTFTSGDGACAHVAGAAALLFATAPGATADDVKTALLETVDVSPGLTNRVVSNGRLNVGKAIYHPNIVNKAVRFKSIARLVDGSLRLAIETLVPVEVVLETSVDLVGWTSLATLTVNRQAEFTDTEARFDHQRFYRAKLTSP